MINRNDSVQNAAKNFKLPPIQGAPTADVLRKPTARQNQAPVRRPKQNEQDSRQAFVAPNLKPVGQQRRYRHATSRAAGYTSVKTANMPRKPLIERDFINPRLVAQAGHASDFLRSYAVLPPIKSEGTNARSAKQVEKPGSESSSISPKASEKKKNKEGKTKQKSGKSREAKDTVISAGERQTSATLLLFYEGTRKDRRVGVCPENEPTLINITEQLKEIFLRRNMEEMYLI